MNYIQPGLVKTLIIRRQSFPIRKEKYLIKQYRTMEAKKQIFHCLLMNSPLINLISFTAHVHFKLNKLNDVRFTHQIDSSN